MRTFNLQWNEPASEKGQKTLPVGGTPAGSEIVLDPPLAPRDEAVFLLHVAAEIEHTLLVQYLYAAFSLRLDGDFGPGAPPNAAVLTNSWFNAIFQTAQEEMGHLMTVQNILRFIGGPLTLEREDFPFRSDVYPFHFRLQPLARNSLAKYVAAERPDNLVLPADEQKALDELLARVHQGNRESINRVGRVYDRLLKVTSSLTPDQFRPDLSDFQGTAVDWAGQEPETLVQRNATGEIVSVGEGVLVFQVKSAKDLRDALTAVAIQGEGGGADSATSLHSHFRRFFNIYLDANFPDELVVPMAWHPDRPVAVNPNTTIAPPNPDALYPEEKDEEKELAKGRITNTQTRLWAQLFNTRYRILLFCIGHSLRVPAKEPNRNQLIVWAFAEMQNVGRLAVLLAGMDRTMDPNGGKAGATFELPYTLNASDDNRDRWRTQQDLLLSASLLYQKIQPADDAQAGVLKALQADDGVDDQSGRRKEIAAFIQTVNNPAGDGTGKASFARDILPLFRPIDIQHMKPMGVMLSDFNYMSDPNAAQKVLDTLSEKSMPPGGPFWSPAQLELFKKWMTDGLLP
jgi:hypothetical protein